MSTTEQGQGPAEGTANTEGKTPQELAMLKAGETRELTPEEAHDATDYYMGRRQRKGKGKPFPLEMDFGTPEEPDLQEIMFRRLRVEDLNDAAAKAQIKDDDGDIIGSDAYIEASWVVARAQIEPPLGPIVQHDIVTNGKNWPDAATFLQDFWAEDPGVLLRTASLIRLRARVGDSNAAREVEAGKTSR